MDTKETQTRN